MPGERVGTAHMRAVAVRAFHGIPELMELEAPVPGPGEVLVRMAAAGINPFDWKIVDGILDGRRPHRFPLVIGVDGSGRVETVGKGVSRFQEGDPIVGQFLHDPVGIGTVAEYATVPASIGVARFPPAIGPLAAAALPTAGMTALDALDRLDVGPGSSLVVVGASGGIGSFAIQLGKAWGARVTAVARAGSAGRLTALGATDFLEYDPDRLQEGVRGIYPEGVDALLDVMSRGPEFARLSRLVRPGGHAATTVYAVSPEHPTARGVEAITIDLQPNAGLLERLLSEFVTHRLTVPIERTISLEEAAAALAESRTGRTVGKTVVKIADDSSPPR